MHFGAAETLWPAEDGLDRMGLMLGGSDEDNKAALVLFMAAWYCLVAVGFGCQLSKLQNVANKLNS